MNHYRVWLLAYPRDYRRRHGLELLTTLMDAARPGSTRPDRADVVDLVRGGLRQRFRLPVGRWALILAIVAALFGAGTGAAAGAWADWRSSSIAMPADAEAFRLSALAFEPYRLGAEPMYATEYDGIPELSTWGPLDDGWNPQASATRIAAEGWDVGPVESGPHTGVHRRTAFTAERNGVLMTYTVEYTDTVAYGGVSFRPVVPWTVVAAAVAGALIAGVATWLFVAWAAYRIRRAAPRRQVAGLLAGVAALAALTLPSAGIYLTMVEAAMSDPLNPRTVYPLWGAFSGFDQFYVVAGVCLLCAGLLAATARPASQPSVTPLA